MEIDRIKTDAGPTIADNDTDNDTATETSAAIPHQVWISHSWGGVMMTSSFVRYPTLLARIACQVHFGTKRCISQVWSKEYLWRVGIGWNILCPLLGRVYGYVPIKKVHVQ